MWSTFFEILEARALDTILKLTIILERVAIQNGLRQGWAVHGPQAILMRPLQASRRKELIWMNIMCTLIELWVRPVTNSTSLFQPAVVKRFPTTGLKWAKNFTKWSKIVIFLPVNDSYLSNWRTWRVLAKALLEAGPGCNVSWEI